MDTNSVDWRGYIPAITTPFDREGALDTEAFRRLLCWLLDEGVHGVIVLGTTGEWFSLHREERRAVLRLAGDELHGRITLIAGCNDYTSAGAAENARLAADCGFDGVLLTPPPYIRPTEREIHAYYAAFDRACPLPVCVYNWPPGTGVDMSLELLSALADLGNVVALKNSTADLRRFTDTVFALRDRVRVFGAPMNDLGITLVRHCGVMGTMGAGAVLGRDHADFFNELWAGNLERAREIGQRDVKLMADWFHPDYTGRFGSAQAIFKEALNQQGLPGGWPRPPILPLDEAGVATVRATLRALGRAR